MMVSDKTVLESIEDFGAVFLGCSHDTIFFVWESFRLE